MSAKRKVMVIGLDCATPQLVFGPWLKDLPNLRRLTERGTYGELESIVPPITVPAWTCMMTSKDPGQLGFYGFRNRSSYSYKEMSLANSRSVKEDTVWDILTRAGKTSILVGVPQTYPPKPINGAIVGCFLTPSTDSDYTYPSELKQEIERVADGYVLDVEDFRTNDKDRLLKQIYEMTEKRFKVAKHLSRTRDWDFFMFVDMGPDRIHHGLWKYTDPEHPKYEKGTPYENGIRDYYRWLDGLIGDLVATLDDDTVVLVVSDHGAKRMDGGICMNEWLIENGYLTLKSQPAGIVPLEKAEVDWSRTRAWGSGGYYGRLFMNVRGREPEGTIEPGDYEAVRDELISKLAAIADPGGKNIGTRAFKPENVYRTVRGIAPDLIVYYGDLYWRSVGSVGHGSIWTFDNDTGPDDANHAERGIFIMYDPGQPGRGRIDGLHITDTAPTVLRLLGHTVPEDMVGKSIV